MEARDWAALPSDILLDIFLRLGPREVMLGAEFACKPWRRVALEDPSLWRRVGMDRRPRHLYFDKRWRRAVRRGADTKMARVAADRAKGQCETFKGTCNGGNLLHLVRRAPSLRSLNIEYLGYYNAYSAKFIQALQNLTLLADLQIHFKRCLDWDVNIYWDENMIQSVCEACPRLRKLVLMFPSATDLECNEDEFHKAPVDEAVPLMAELHTLELYDCDLSVWGLNAILDSCPMLETLHIDGYFDKQEMDKELMLKCSKVKNLTLDTRKEPRNWYFDEFWSEEETEMS